MRLGRAGMWWLTALVCAGSTGCHRRRVVAVAPPLPPAPAVEMHVEPAAASGLIPEVPLTVSPMPKKAMYPKVRPKRKPVEPVPAAAPAETVTAPAAPAAANVVGSLTAGGDAGRRQSSVRGMRLPGWRGGLWGWLPRPPMHSGRACCGCGTSCGRRGRRCRRGMRTERRRWR